MVTPHASTTPGASVELSQGRFVIDGRPRILFAGEVHYFRLQRSQWRDRLESLRDAGAQAVATYIPWVAHELADGTIDVTGATEEWRDVGAFCDLAAELGLYVIARPGPFVMAELKNEGIPHRVHGIDGVTPTSWDSRPLPTRDLDYLSERFLAEVQRWYAAVLPLLAARQHARGGPVIAVQLDNEIGMLAWVSNSPHLTEPVAVAFLDHLVDTHRLDRHPALTASSTPTETLAHLRRPPADQAVAVADDLMRFCRLRFRDYVDVLTELARAQGIDSVPFLVNIHGTSASRGLTYPIGISQLMGTWRYRAGVAAGSDMYLGDLTVTNVADFVLGNLFAAAVAGGDQPLTALEFEAGDGGYGEDLGTLVPPEATELRTRLAHGLGNRLMNFYLYAGGTNPPLERDPARPEGDGIDRLAFTGEHHGFAAPIGPTGEPNSSHAPLVRVVRALNAVEEQAASMVPHRDLTVGFVSDAYLTEYRVPGDAPTQAIQDDQARFRGFGSRQVMARALVLGGYGLDAVDVCLHPELDDPAAAAAAPGAVPAELSVAAHPVLALASSHHLAADTQQHLLDYVTDGGRLLLSGVLPTHDELGAPCSVLADGLGLRVVGERGDQVIDEIGRERVYYATVQASEALGRRFPEVRTGYAQLLEPASPTAEVLVHEIGSGAPCAVEVSCGGGTAVVVAVDYPCDLTFWTALLDRLGVVRRWTSDATAPGLVLASLRDPDGPAELLHVLNVAPYALTVDLWREGVKMTTDPLTVPARGAELLSF